MKKELHIVLGASGPVGRAVIEALNAQDKEVIAVGRSKRVRGVENRSADLLIMSELNKAVSGATHVYLCAGLTYDIKVWQRDWPIVMSNAIAACEAEEAVLIFIDNIYMYGPHPLMNPFDEAHPQEASSKKGKVRKQIASMLLNAHADGRIKGVIGRAADFYGPSVESSVLYISFLERILKGKNPQTLGGLDQKHTFAYTPDIGNALVALALDPMTYGQAWHLPVSKALTIEEVVVVVNGLMESDYKASKIPPIMLKCLGLFMTTVKEIDEMLYQFKEPYIMDSGKFLKHFPDFETTDFEDGMKSMIESFKSKRY